MDQFHRQEFAFLNALLLDVVPGYETAPSYTLTSQLFHRAEHTLGISRLAFSHADGIPWTVIHESKIFL